MPDTPTMTTHVDGREVRVPATIAAVRAQLGDDERAQFDREVETTPVLQLPALVIGWALPAEAHDADTELMDRIARGETGGVHPGTQLA
ncbi:hypothetical protein [Streptomyces sp. GSL17-111]|uniref:hypothetical protein n=1 Tax=Streptomyces sp. GSL17-111 TaxID=3121596 RepID=UPI0030F38DBC